MDDLNGPRKGQSPFQELQEKECLGIQVKNAVHGFPSAADTVCDLTNTLDALGASARPRSAWAAYAVPALVLVLLTIGVSVGFYQRLEKRLWAREHAGPEIVRLASENKPVAAFLLARRAQKYLPGDPRLALMIDALTDVTSVRSLPAGASVEIKDYLSPDDPWSVLGTTPLDNIRIPSGYLRWRLSKAGMGEYSGAPIDFGVGAGTIFGLGAAGEKNSARR
jgi:hypothetical protein